MEQEKEKEMIQQHQVLDRGGGGGGGRDGRRGSKPVDKWQLKTECSRGEKADRNKISGILNRRKEKGGVQVRVGVWFSFGVWFIFAVLQGIVSPASFIPTNTWNNKNNPVAQQQPAESAKGFKPSR